MVSFCPLLAPLLAPLLEPPPASSVPPLVPPLLVPLLDDTPASSSNRTSGIEEQPTRQPRAMSSAARMAPKS